MAWYTELHAYFDYYIDLWIKWNLKDQFKWLPAAVDLGIVLVCFIWKPSCFPTLRAVTKAANNLDNFPIYRFGMV